MSLRQFIEDVNSSALLTPVIVDPFSIVSLVALAAQSVLTLAELVNDFRGFDGTVLSLPFYGRSLATDSDLCMRSIKIQSSGFSERPKSSKQKLPLC